VVFCFGRDITQTTDVGLNITQALSRLYDIALLCSSAFDSESVSTFSPLDKHILAYHVVMYTLRPIQAHSPKAPKII